MEKGWRKKFDDIHNKIMDGYHRGVCNKNGESVKCNGVYIGKPRVMGYSKTLCNRCGQWYITKEEHICTGERK